MTRRIWHSLGFRRSSAAQLAGTADERAGYRSSWCPTCASTRGCWTTTAGGGSRPTRAGARPKNPALAGIIPPRREPARLPGAPTRAPTSTRSCAGLRAAGLAFVINPRLVRGPRLLRAHRVRVGHDRARGAGTVRRRPLHGLVEQLGGRSTRPWDSRSGRAHRGRCWETAAAGRARRATRLSGRVRCGGGGPGPVARPSVARPLALACGWSCTVRRRTQGAVQACRPKRGRRGAGPRRSELARGVVGLKPLRVEGEQEEIRATSWPACWPCGLRAD